MKHAARFDFKLPATQRRELAELAAATGLSSADLVRLSVAQLIAHPSPLLATMRAAARGQGEPDRRPA